MRDSFEKSIALAKVGDAFEWRKWMKEIPYLQFPSDWKVKAIPPFGTGIIRYWVTKDGLGDKHVSIYLDCYDMAGCMDEPYWEVYPHEGDVGRCSMSDTAELLKLISESLIEQTK